MSPASGISPKSGTLVKRSSGTLIRLSSKPPAFGRSPASHALVRLSAIPRAPDLPALEPYWSSYTASSAPSDLTVKVGGSNFGVHKVVLAAKSGWFRQTFELENGKRPWKVIELHGDHPTAVKIALRFMYEGRFGPDLSQLHPPLTMNVRRHLTLYQFAEKYDIPSLADATASMVRGLFNRNNRIARYLDIAQTLYTRIPHDEHDLKRAYLDGLHCRVCVLSGGMLQLARKNHGFAGDVVALIASTSTAYECAACNLGMAIKIQMNSGATKFENDTMGWATPSCPRCRGRLVAVET